ncbi:hypothetical protein [Pseudomonas aeruginosa]
MIDTYCRTCTAVAARHQRVKVNPVPYRVTLIAAEHLRLGELQRRGRRGS